MLAHMKDAYQQGVFIREPVRAAAVDVPFHRAFPHGECQRVRPRRDERSMDLDNEHGTLIDFFLQRDFVVTGIRGFLFLRVFASECIAALFENINGLCKVSCMHRKVDIDHVPHAAVRIKREGKRQAFEK